MAAPTPTVRVTPGGIRLEDGCSSKVTFSLDPDIALWEQEVTPPEVDGGERIDISTMWETDWKAYVAQCVKDLMPFTFTAAYDPDAYDEVVAIINNDSGSVTVTFPDGSTLAFFGYLQKFSPSNMTKGSMPLATVTVAPTNYDKTNHVVAGPVMTEVAGS